MADDTQDESEKTEEPTQRRMNKARDEGNVAVSQEVKSWMVLLGATFALLFIAPWAAGRVVRGLRPYLEFPHTISADFFALRETLVHTLGTMALILSIPVSLFVLMAILGSIGQVGFLFTPKKLEPKLNKISVIAGLKRMFSLRQVVEALKAVFKLILVVGALVIVIWPRLDALMLFPTMEMQAILRVVYEFAILVLVTVLAVLTAIAAFDIAFQRYTHKKKLRMSRKDIKDEHKQTEGDPHVKARIASIRRERAQKRMMAAVPDADVVITNPTHYAVALSYDMDSMAAPKLVAKGVDLIALKIRETAEENDVPIVENPPLARALYASVEIDHEIPTEHYRAVAEVIGYVMRLKGKIPA